MEKVRYSELDWLRVILILAVFLHHVFMPFNGDDWHVMNADSSKLLDHIMVYFEQLRLPTLFFIAGAGSYLLLQRSSAQSFLIDKFKRLFVPLMVGMMLIVPPQVYFENINDYHNIVDAYQNLVFSFNANHLWFIEFLVVIMLLALPLNALLNSSKATTFISKLAALTNKKHGLFALGIIIIIARLGFKLWQPQQSHNIENLSVSVFYFLFFLSGMYCIKSPSIWQALLIHRQVNLKWFVASSLLFYAYYFSPDLSGYMSLQVRWQLWWLVCTLVSWTALLALVGYASALCQHTPNWLKGANELIYPFYILHQTIIVVLAFYIVQWQVGIALKSTSLMLSSLLITAGLCYFVIKPVKVFRVLFGLKPV